MITQDEWYGHRNHFTGEPEGDREEWVPWDFILAQAYQLVTDFTNQYGFLEWESDDPYGVVTVVPELKIDKVEQSLELGKKNRDTARRLERVAGSKLVPRLKKKKDKEWPSHVEYFKYLAEKYPDDE